MSGGDLGLFESEPMAVAPGAAVVVQFGWHPSPSDGSSLDGRAEPTAVLYLDQAGVATVLLCARLPGALEGLTQGGPIPGRAQRAAIGRLAWRFAGGRGTLFVVHVEGGTPTPMGPGRVIELPR